MLECFFIFFGVHIMCYFGESHTMCYTGLLTTKRLILKCFPDIPPVEIKCVLMGFT